MPAENATARRLQRWGEHADPLERQAARVLATALTSSPQSLLATVGSVFNVTSNADLLDATRSLLDRPFVERVDEGYRIAEPTAAALRQQFREGDAEAFRDVNAGLLAQEQQALNSQVDEEERWFIRGRIAYYLAALDPSESAEQFIATFAAPLPGDPGPQRSWLADLALRQRDLLADETRALEFFEGFRAYKQGNYGSARTHFENVIETDERDQYRAISLHLWSVLVDRGRRSEERLREAVRLSEELGLTENEVMSRNSLVFRLLDRARRSMPIEIAALQEASNLADRNLARAERTHDRFLITGSRFGMAQAKWLNFSDGGSEADRVPEGIVSSLSQSLATVADDASAMNDIETAAAAINALASIQRDRHMYRQAIDVLADGYSRWQDYGAPRAAERWAKTAGSMLNLGLDSETLEDLHQLLTNLNYWLSEAG